MQQLMRIVESPRTCSYLPGETASLEIRAITNMSSDEYGDLLARGYRRFGWNVFRPACAACSECRSVRIPVDRFTPSASARRVLRSNEHIRAELHPLFATHEHIELYNRYHEFMHQDKGWPGDRITARSYGEEFLSGASQLGRQWLYFDQDRLVGVALMDEAPDAISLVYCFYDPDWRPKSPGTFSILKQLLYAQETGRKYAYLGYLVDGCASMRYKRRFHPLEELLEYPADAVSPEWS